MEDWRANGRHNGHFGSTCYPLIRSMLLTQFLRGGDAPCGEPAARPGRDLSSPIRSSRLHPSRGVRLQYRSRRRPCAKPVLLLGTQTDRVPCSWDRFLY